MKETFEPGDVVWAVEKKSGYYRHTVGEVVAVHPRGLLVDIIRLEYRFPYHVDRREISPSVDEPDGYGTGAYAMLLWQNVSSLRKETSHVD